MKKFNSFLVALLAGASIISANPVSVNVAKTAATNFYGQTYSAPSQTLTLTYTELDNAGNPVYYVFNVNENDGFVIISAEDAGSPIIGSSNKGQYVIPTENNNVSFWMNKRKNEIISIRASKLVATTDVSNEWSAYINNTIRKTHQTMSSVSPLCLTEWDQSPYYNAYCPHGSLTGCVATAMAQIMKYWSFPAVGTGSSCYEDVTMDGYQENYGELCATYDTAHYAWSSMPTMVNNSTEEKEVAKLMYDCGVSVDMDYSPSGSGATVIGYQPSAEWSYKAYFGYDASTIVGKLMSSYSDNAWITLIEAELNAKRPVQYQGTDPTQGGHSWVCDGYNTTNELHMNWGWSGYDDGYYAATALVVDGYDFSEDVGAIIGIEPYVLSVPTVLNNEGFKVYPNPGNGMFNIELKDITGNPQISVCNVLGQEVYTSRLTTLQSTMNLSAQSKGVYIYRVATETGKQISTGKLVIE